MRTAKRLLLTFIAFIFGSVFIAVWKDNVPPSAATGAIMAVIAVGIVFGAWKWGERLK